MLQLILIILIATWLLERILDRLNMLCSKTELPAELRGIYDEAKYRQSLEYDKEKTRFGMITSTVSLLLLLALLLTGSFALLNNWVLSLTQQPVLAALLFFAVLAVLSDFVSLPFSWYRVFVIEEKFGFNRTTLKTFVLDKIKGYLLGAVIGGSLLWLFAGFYFSAGKNFWWIAWIAFSAVMLFMTMFYASLIVPLFNKLTPLPEGELRNAIEEYCRKENFRLKNLFVMDGSKRSSKANAFFNGVGGKQKIVLFDTLIQNHTTGEVVAVLAHEIGHYKKKHAQLGLLLSVAQAGLMLFIFSLVINNSALSNALGAPEPHLQLGMLAFGILYSPLSLILSVLMNMVSRRYEFAADHFAKTTYSGEELISALKKLSAHNLSNLLPHPAYVFFYYSHPPLPERLNELRN